MKLVSEIDWNNHKFIRAGIIPFVDTGDTKFFAFGVENGVAAIGDFGGHCDRIDRDALDSAIREYEEEALNVFGKLNRNILKDCHAIEGTDTVEIFLPVKGPLYQYTETFRDLVGTNTEHEVQNIIWLSKSQLLKAIDSQESHFKGTKTYHMYYRLRDVINLHRDEI